MNVLITGITGFLGTKLSDRLKAEHGVTGVVRSNRYSESESTVVADFSSNFNLISSLSIVDCVVHCAALAHVDHDANEEILNSFLQVNTVATLELARQAAQSGVRRFIFISSIGVNGLVTKESFKFDDVADPKEPYAVSKLEAEIGLRKLSKETGLEVVIIRPPLVYGANAPGNFSKLLALADLNLPLPLGAINNKRSLVSVDNLTDFIAICIDHPKAANQLFLISDDHDVSTTELLESMILAAGRKPFLLPISVYILSFFANLLGKKALIDRMSSNLQVDVSHTKSTLNWEPAISFDEGIRRCFN